MLQNENNKKLQLTIDMIKKMLPCIFIFEMLYKGLTALIIKPLLSFILGFMLTISGYQLAFNELIVGFFLTAPGIIAAVLLIIISAIFTYFEFSVIILLVYYYKQGQYISLTHVIKKAILTLKSLKNPGLIGFSVYALGLLPIANMGISSTLLPQLGIPNFVSGELAKNAWGSYVLTAFAVFVFVLFFCTIFVLPVMVLEGKSFGKALRRNCGLLKSSGKRLIGIFGGFLLTWGVMFGFPRFILSRLFNSYSVGAIKIYEIYGLSWQTFVLVLLVAFVAVIQLFLMPILLSLVTHNYIRIAPENWISTDFVLLADKDIIKPDGMLENIKKILSLWTSLNQNKVFRKIKYIASTILIVLVGYGIFNIFYTPPALHEPIVIAHRGSAYGVENTLESIQGAIDAGADYAEVDILLSSDGVPMVIHDSNLERLSRINVNVYELTASDLAELTLSQNGYEGRISTLDEVIQYCNGKINLAIELKLHGHEQENIVEQIMQVVESNNYLGNCMFISLSYDLIAEMNEKYPSATAGYCVYGNVGTLDLTLMTMAIDFVVIEESMATRSTVYDFRKSWLPVYVWTVNDAGSMESYLEMGIIGIVSDYPDIAKEAVASFNSASNAVYLDEAEWKD